MAIQKEAFRERRKSQTRPIPGDIVEVTWRDHFQYQGESPATSGVVVKSWGRLDFEGEEGVALTQTAVIMSEHPVESIHTGQFIVRGAMTEIKKINTTNLNNLKP